ncbi:non-canonical purine NTP pyrophosphatase [soil metagenome]
MPFRSDGHVANNNKNNYMKIFFVTRNKNKQAEVQSYLDSIDPKDRYPVELCFANKDLQEILDANIETIVRAKALEAYKYLGAPCVVEHGGIFIESLKEFPGGVGQVVWNSIGERMCSFLGEGDSRVATARSVIGYCDGKRITTFAGETKGKIALQSRGNYHFNWDPIFAPEGSEQTYGEMGPELKRATSQAIKAWNCFLGSLKDVQ